jgi:hypothetical protein
VRFLRRMMNVLRTARISNDVIVKMSDKGKRRRKRQSQFKEHILGKGKIK